MTQINTPPFPKICALVLCTLALSACKEDAPGPDASPAEIMLFEASNAEFQTWVRESGDTSEALNTIDEVYAELLVKTPNDPRLRAELQIVEDAKALLGEAFMQDARQSDRKANAAIQAYLTAWTNAEIAAQDRYDTLIAEIETKLALDQDENLSEPEWIELRQTVAADLADKDIGPIVRAYLMDPSNFEAAERLRQITATLGDTEAFLYYARINHGLHSSAYISGGEHSAYFAYGLALHNAGEHDAAWPILTHNMGSIASPSSDYSGQLYIPARANYVSLMIAAPDNEQAVWAASHNLMLALRTDFTRTDAALNDAERSDPLIRQQTTQNYLRFAEDLWEIGLTQEAHAFLAEGIAYTKDHPDLAQPLSDWAAAHPI